MKGEKGVGPLVPAPTETTLTPEESLALARKLLDPASAGGRLSEDEFGDLQYAVRGTFSQLEADAMNDRLQAFILREVEPVLPGARAEVSYLNARPADHDPGELDLEAVWHGVEAVFRLDVHRHAPTGADVQRWVAFLPRFHAVVDASGRPEGYRPDIHAGSAE